MGVITVLPLSALADGWVLAPERYDPERQVEVESDVLVQDLFEVVTDNVGPKAMSGRPVLVLDTTHACEGFVLYRHSPCTSSGLGSSKRQLQPGDVIISRLRPYLRQVAFVDSALFNLAEGGNSVVASTEFFVLRSKGAMSAAALVPYLLCDRVQSALAAAQEGGHHPRFGRDSIASLPVPRWVIAEATSVACRVERLAETVRASMLERDKLVQVASSRVLATVDESESREALPDLTEAK
jgi:hypothetical protein